MLTSLMVCAGVTATACIAAVFVVAARPLTEPAISKEGNPYPKAFPPNLPGSAELWEHPRVRMITYLLAGAYGSIAFVLLCTFFSLL